MTRSTLTSVPDATNTNNTRTVACPDSSGSVVRVEPTIQTSGHYDPLLMAWLKIEEFLKEEEERENSRQAA